MHTVKILLVEDVTHDTKRFIVEKPKGYEFTPGQATDVAINQPDWKEAKRPFTFTSLNEDKVLEFTIKGYDPKEHPDHDGMTYHLHTLKPGAELLIEDPWGTIEYKGPGVFLAAGAGITPFIAIFKHLDKKDELQGNKLIYSNKTSEDIILEQQLKNWFDKDNLVLTLTREEKPGYEKGRVNEEFIENYVDDFSQDFYICGPPPFLGDVKETLANFGASVDSIVFEK